jgi:hypothetical protein
MQETALVKLQKEYLLITHMLLGWKKNLGAAKHPRA